MTHPPAPVASYRALLDVPSLARALAGMQTARIAQSMVGLAAVLFTLQRYHSPELAGLVTFAAIAPGIVVSPIAGALLDRHGRARLISLDFVIAAFAMVLIGVLALADALPAWLLILIAAVSALTSPLSAVGLRSLFPLMAPRHLWERMNAIDANGYVVAQIIGPPIAAVLVSVLGGPWALVILGGVYGVAAAIIVGVVEPPAQLVASSGRLLLDAWQGVVYTLRNPTLRGIAASLTLSNVGGGIATIALPLIILNRFGLGEAAIGILYAMQGLVGLVAGVFAGRMDTRDRERRLIVGPMFGYALGNVLLLPVLGLPIVTGALLFMGLISAPMDVALFTLRQRRTDPAWMGRAFAVSMNLNFAGFPIGSAIGGFLAAQSIELAIVVAVAFALAGAILSAALIPARAQATVPGTGRDRRRPIGRDGLRITRRLAAGGRSAVLVEEAAHVLQEEAAVAALADLVVLELAAVAEALHGVDVEMEHLRDFGGGEHLAELSDCHGGHALGRLSSCGRSDPARHRIAPYRPAPRGAKPYFGQVRGSTLERGAVRASTVRLGARAVGGRAERRRPHAADLRLAIGRVGVHTRTANAS